MITSEIGFNAGKIWNLLNEEGEHSHKEVQKKLKMTSADFYMAVGWLAREGKICHFDNNDVMKVRLK